MDLFEAIEKRYSYRGEFKPEPVPREHLKKIVEAGIRAPSACNQQVVSFVVVDDPDLLEKAAKIIDRPVCYTAKAMIVCIYDPRPVYHDMSFAQEDCGAAVENMLLAITALGLRYRVARRRAAGRRPRRTRRPAARRAGR